MTRRMFYLFADDSRGTALLADLNAAGIGAEHLHAVTGGGGSLRQFPPATLRQQRDRVWQIERWLWAGNLVLFALAAIGLALALIAGHVPAALGAAAVMVASFTAGLVFVRHMPETHLGELDIALKHGDVVLMVDVPKQRVNEVAELIRQRYPEAEASGLGWTIPALGL